MFRNLYSLTILAFSTLLSCPLFSYYPQDFDTPLSSIAFGSCNRENLPQPLWSVIPKAKPDLWIWGGDNVYLNSPYTDVLEERYTLQFNNTQYVAFRKSIPIIGTWDDHDYGENDSLKWFQSKVIAQNLALNFLEEPADSPRRDQEGIYTAYTFGPNGK